MSKAILILNEMPESCNDCRIQDYYCVVTGEPVGTTEMPLPPPSWCPLHPMPEPKECPSYFMSDELYGYERGWNECLRAIERSGEDVDKEREN